MIQRALVDSVLVVENGEKTLHLEPSQLYGSEAPTSYYAEASTLRLLPGECPAKIVLHRSYGVEGGDSVERFWRDQTLTDSQGEVVGWEYVSGWSRICIWND